MIFSMLLMGCGTLTKTVYVKQTIPPLPTPPDYYSVEWSGDYCLDEQNAKNLLKNKALIDDYVQQLIALIEGLR